MMTPPSFKAKAYLKEGCPFSFKFYLFMVEAGLADQLEAIRCKPDTAEFEQVKAKLAQGLGKPATFPTVEIEPGRYQADSDALIEHFAKKNGVKSEGLPALAFYEETILPQVVELHKLKNQK
jgi:hypothetical protein